MVGLASILFFLEPVLEFLDREQWPEELSSLSLTSKRLNERVEAYCVSVLVRLAAAQPHAWLTESVGLSAKRAKAFWSRPRSLLFDSHGDRRGSFWLIPAGASSPLQFRRGPYSSLKRCSRSTFVCHRGLVYLLGGLDAQSRGTTEVMTPHSPTHPTRGVVLPGPPLPLPLDEVIACSHGGRLLLLGGRKALPPPPPQQQQQEGWSRLVWRLCDDGSGWEEEPTMALAPFVSRGAGRPQSVSCGCRLWVFGGTVPAPTQPCSSCLMVHGRCQVCGQTGTGVAGGGTGNAFIHAAFFDASLCPPRWVSAPPIAAIKGLVWRDAKLLVFQGGLFLACQLAHPAAKELAVFRVDGSSGGTVLLGSPLKLSSPASDASTTTTTAAAVVRICAHGPLVTFVHSQFAVQFCLRRCDWRSHAPIRHDDDPRTLSGVRWQSGAAGTVTAETTEEFRLLEQLSPAVDIVSLVA